MCDYGPHCKMSAPLMIGSVFAVALLMIRTRIRCPIYLVPHPEVRDKTTEINGLTLSIEQVGLC